ncbi:condensation domain-containing protein, partial [Paenibacillus sp. Marseille-Q4541]|uniref:condensation domain-containing protein n=1 Tax=Paenibacillus sp. Marseille-Q4541 TaxID=2831522 RepID=UPI00201873C1
MSRKYKMSSAQKRLFVLHEMHKSDITYNIPILLKVKGELNVDQLSQAFNQLCSRHELLRTHFSHNKDKFLQIIEDEVQLKLEYSVGRLEAIPNLFEQFIRPFNLREAPLMRAKLVQTSKDEYILMLDIHHIIFDDGSTDVLLSDLSCLYSGMKLPELRVQYKDYSAWQNARDLQEQEAYWLEEFSGDVPVLDVKTDYARPQHQSHKGGSLNTWVTRKHNEAVKKLAKRSGATEYMVLLSAFMQLMGRYSRQEEIVV